MADNCFQEASGGNVDPRRGPGQPNKGWEITDSKGVDRLTTLSTFADIALRRFVIEQPKIREPGKAYTSALIQTVQMVIFLFLQI